MHRSLSILQYSTRYRHIRQSDVWHPKISRLSNRYIPLLLRNKSLNLVLWTQIKFQENLSILYWEFGDWKQIKFHSRYFFVISSLYSYQMHTYTTIVKDWLITIDLSRFGRWPDRNRKKTGMFLQFSWFIRVSLMHRHDLQKMRLRNRGHMDRERPQVAQTYFLHQ